VVEMRVMIFSTLQALWMKMRRMYDYSCGPGVDAIVRKLSVGETGSSWCTEYSTFVVDRSLDDD
jgi:hypothetical protein